MFEELESFNGTHTTKLEKSSANNNICLNPSLVSGKPVITSIDQDIRGLFGFGKMLIL